MTYDWGNDITDYIEKWTGMKTKIFDFPQTEETIKNGLEADYLHVLVTYKT